MRVIAFVTSLLITISWSCLGFYMLEPNALDLFIYFCINLMGVIINIVLFQNIIDNQKPKNNENN